MRIITGSTLCFFLISGCGKATFTGMAPKPTKNQQSPKADETAVAAAPEESIAEADAPIAQDSASPAADSAPAPSILSPLEKLDIASCSKLMADNPDQVIKTSQSPASLGLKDNSVVLLDVTGKATISLDAKDIKSIKALCVTASGQGALAVNTSLIVGGVYFVGRGSSSLAVDFGTTGILANMAADVGGGSSLSLKGDQIDCAKLASAVGGSRTVLCNGKAL